jgi:glycosyltransferase involved in cell wall biosynthesis
MNFSVIIPSKNEEKHIGPLLEDIKYQTSQPIEVILADNESTDRTRDIAREYGIKIIKGGLPGPARNRGAEVAKGDVLIFLDADDRIYNRQFFEKVMNRFNRRGVDMLTCAVQVYSGTLLQRALHSVYNFFIFWKSLILPHAAGVFMAVKKEHHEKINGFDEEILYAEDNDYTLRVHRAGGRFRYLPFLKVHTSPRRFYTEGTMRFVVKCILAELHMRFKGPIKHNGFDYGFDHKEYEHHK